MHTRNRIVPRTEPFGMPGETEILSDLIPFIITVCFRIYKKSLNQFKIVSIYDRMMMF